MKIFSGLIKSSFSYIPIPMKRALLLKYIEDKLNGNKNLRTSIIDIVWTPSCCGKQRVTSTIVESLPSCLRYSDDVMIQNDINKVIY